MIGILIITQRTNISNQNRLSSYSKYNITPETPVPNLSP